MARPIRRTHEAGMLLKIYSDPNEERAAFLLAWELVRIRGVTDGKFALLDHINELMNDHLGVPLWSVTKQRACDQAFPQEHETRARVRELLG